MSDPLIDWIRASGLTLPPIERWADLAPDTLSLLDPLIEGAQAIYLGEMDHFIHEKTDFRLLLIRYLAAKGIARIAEECSWSDGRRIQIYLNEVYEDAFDYLAGFGWENEKRKDRDDSMKGAIAGGGPYPVETFSAEQKRFYRGLRQMQAWRFFGIDVDAIPGGAYIDITTRLKRIREDPDVAGWLASLQRVEGETQAEEAARLRACLKSLGDIAPKLYVEEIRDVGLSIACLAETLDYIQLAYDQPTFEALAPGLAYREDILKRQALAALDYGEREPTIFLAHALHLLKDDALGGANGPSGPGGGQVPSLGHFLTVQNQVPTFSIWLIWAEGEDSQPYASLPQKFAYSKHSLNKRLAPLNAPTLFPVTGAPSGLFDHPMQVAHMYNAEVTVTLQGQADAILWLPKVGPLRK